MKQKSRYWVVADLHLGHKMLVDKGYRPELFESLLADNWNRLVSEDDVVFVLGDVSFNDEMYNFFIPKLNGRKILVRGNHDSKSNMWYMNNGFAFACDDFYLDYGGKDILFSHIPTVCDEINIHGHLHRKSIETSHPTTLYYGFALEDTEYKPILLDDVLKEIDAYIKQLKHEE